MSTAPHARILAAAARVALKPLGVQQVGRSRVWRDDRRWYVILIEFQPSGFAKGSHLNVGVSWLHYEKPHLSFDVGYREKAFVEDRNDEQFTSAAQELGWERERAAAANDLRERLARPDAYRRRVADTITKTRALNKLAETAEPFD